jgi:long-chain acyl-CoA synthetase
MMELKPTLLAGVPQVFENVQEGIKNTLQEPNPVKARIGGRLRDAIKQ